MEDQKCLVASCGTYCGECECYTCRDSNELKKYLISKGMDEAKLPCPGCREVKGECTALKGTCPTYLCIQEKAVDFCYECNEYPCIKLCPCSDKANILPHNMKLANLCMIEHQGIDKMIAGFKQQKLNYFKGKMVIGEGPKID